MHADERKQFERLLRRYGADRMADRMAVAEAFLSSEDHHSAEQWHALLEGRGVRLPLGFVEGTLDLMARLGLCDRREFQGSAPLYEHRHLGDHHDHLICARCGSITEFERPELEALKRSVAADHGFHHLRHTLQIYGLCRRCLAGRKPAAPLASAAAGERLRIERINGGEKLSKQLLAMGLTVGTELEVISNTGEMLMIGARNTRIALERGVASKVHVSLI